MMTGIVAALSDQEEHLKYRNIDRPPRLELEEIKAELGDEDVKMDAEAIAEFRNNVFFGICPEYGPGLRRRG